ncbi:unnamed protein product [Xylocopa violacea]|uniref:C2HC/C3H-type domain-containing protein n=1 Tax=Xylocopa violacea TaxID=135666 RepID=A0ABP1P5K5_XYLVO
MAAPQASSRLELLQARFQQKQLQEKEQKLLQLYDQQQQRAYQVVQRGSASSNGSSHSTTVTQHTVTKTSSSSHATSTSQGGKVRQMFDERRQTNVKGIDRSYPLEPLENKPRKQANGNGVQKNGNLTVNRQSVTVKRVARADVNSNLNGGKPVVSYHEEITRESYGAPIRQQQDDDEFGNENYVAQYANGNHRDETHIEEIVDEDAMERNHMMAKLHLMEYDETLKHRVKNDLESEEFPVDYMVDVPDKIPKQSVTKKLSQAEIRLERFKHANAKRVNSITKNPSTVPKKRSDPIYPAKSTSSEDRVKTRTREVLDGRSSDKRTNRAGSKTIERIYENVDHAKMSWDSEKNVRRREGSPRLDAARRSESPKFFCKESEKSATTYAIDSKTARKLSSEFTKSVEKRSESSDFSKTERPRSDSPKFFCRESEKSATTYAIDSKAARKLSSELSKDKIRRGESPKFFCKESEKSATTYAIDSKTARKLSSEESSDRIRRSDSPKFFCKETEKSATTYAIDSSSLTSPDYMKDTESSLLKMEPKYRKDMSGNTAKGSVGIDTVDEKDIKFSTRRPITRSSSPKDQKYENQKKSKSSVFERLRRERSSSPQFFHREDKKSTTTTKSDSKSFILHEKIIDKRNVSPRVSSEKHTSTAVNAAKSKSPDFLSKFFRKSSPSPQFFASDSESCATIMMVTPETITKPRTEFTDTKKRVRSPPSRVSTPVPSAANTITDSKARTLKESSKESSKESAKHFVSSSVTRLFPEQLTKDLRDDRVDSRSNVLSTETEDLRLSRGSSPLSLKEMRAPSPTRSQYHHPGTEKPNKPTERLSSRAPSPRSQKIEDTRGNASEFYCYETEKSATTVSLKPQPPKSSSKGGSKSPRPTEQKVIRRPLAKSKKSESPTRNVENRSSKSPDDSTTAKDTKVLSRRGSSHVLRSTKLIRDAMNLQSDRNQGEYASEKGAKSRSSSSGSADGISIGLKQRARMDEGDKEIVADGEVEERVGTPAAREHSVAESNRRCSTSAEVDTEIQEIVMSDQYVEREQLRGTYTRSSGKTSTDEKLFAYSVQKPTKKRGSLFESSVFEPLKRDRREACDTRQKKRVGASPAPPSVSSSPSPTNESVVRTSIRRTEAIASNRKDETRILRSTPSPRMLEKKMNLKRGTVDVKSAKYGGLKRATRSACSSSPSPTNESIIRVSKARTEEDAMNKSRKRTTSPIRLKGKPIVDSKSMKEKYGGSNYPIRNVWSSSPSPTNESIARHSTRRAERNIASRKSDVQISRFREQRHSPIQQKGRKMDARGTTPSESKKRRTPSPETTRQVEILKSMELVRQAMKESNFKEGRTLTKTVHGETISEGVANELRSEVTKSSSSLSTAIEIREPGSNIVSIKGRTSSSENYERTDSVESALRRFDSIGTEPGTESVRTTLERSKESITGKGQTDSAGIDIPWDGSKTISLEVLDRPNSNLSGVSGSERSTRTPLGKTSPRNAEALAGRKQNGTRETRGQEKFAKSREPIGIGRNVVKSKTAACKRKLFLAADSEEEIETGRSKSRCSLDSARTVERLTGVRKTGTSEPVKTASRRFEFDDPDGAASTGSTGKVETDGTSTGADRCLSVKQLRSIEDIRKSIEGESLARDATGASTESAIASDASVRSSGARRTGPRRINIDDRAGNRKEISSPWRSGNAAAVNDAFEDTDRSSVKCAIRFSRVAKSPSPETTKGMETSTRARRNVPASPSKSPDTVARRPSIEMKAQDTKSTKRPTPMKGTEPIGTRKTMTTTTTTTTTTTASTGMRKSTDVVDGAILENGLHLRDQTAETKYDNGSPTTRKSDAFVIDIDEQPPKENDAPLPRKPLLRKQSSEIPTTQSVRPPSSVSSTSSGGSIQGQTSGSRGKMASRARTPISGSATQKRSASGKSGGCVPAAENLVPCKMCGRRFAQDRVTLHEQICVKTAQKKRKQFDTTMYRVRGTDIEPFYKKGLIKKQPEKLKKPEVKSNWRRKHEDFINAIRSAKQVQAHLAAGGKLSDLPPPPVSDNCDYIQCPHCGRKFNQAAAERHIPKCEHMLHNKPVHSRAPKPRR